jgi:hypothetical protein
MKASQVQLAFVQAGGFQLRPAWRDLAWSLLLDGVLSTNLVPITDNKLATGN